MNVEAVFESYGNMLYRTSFILLRNRQDAEDVLQETLIKYMEQAHKNETRWQDEEHIKAWLLRVSINLCKNRLRSAKRRAAVPLEQIGLSYEKEEDGRLMEALLQLPPKYKAVFLLYYVQGYQIKETAGILKLSEAAVKKRLERGRGKLNILLGGKVYE